MSPEFSYDTYISKQNKLLIYILHIIFVMTTSLATLFSFTLKSLFIKDFSDYISLVIFSGGGLLFGDFIKSKLAKKIRLNEVEDNNEWIDVVDDE